ncbi:hypothetical protein EXIGLDRAFT_261273 [Exidia glandulosa HHB12029]|uniref:RNI-like protein n=1 Tax=Exidia glandulosa HHB12029 TaxID=1314781 RepID=A0A165ZRZ0_EXIGL|nr:hypothetical protein EXIGLDRAFT_261273 [Exidia glandulosa HHB12029]
MVFGGAPRIDLSKMIYPYLQLPTPRLRHLRIYGADVNLGDAQLLPTAPVLSSINVHTLTFRAFARASLPALRELTLMAQDQMPDLTVIGTSFPHLRHLCISRFRIRNDPQTSVPPPFARLESLKVDGFDALACFSPDGLPALTHLSLTILRSPNDDSVRLPDMPVLRKLSIHGQSCWTLALSFFDHVPGVEGLVLRSTQFDRTSTPSFWTQWAQRDSVRTLPRLREITLEGAANKPVDEVTGLWEFLQARCCTP